MIGLAAVALDRRRSDDRRLLDLMIIGGLIGSYMPEPAYAQYLIPLLPPLVPRFALALDALLVRQRRALLLTVALSGGYGLHYTVHLAVRAFRHGSQLVAAVEQGREAAHLAVGGSIVSLSPEVIAGGDTRLDRRFVSGPFLYRTFGALSDEALRFGYSPNWQRIEGALGAEPPGSILVGAEGRPHPLHPQGLDGRLVNWAKAHRYKPLVLREGGFTLFIRG